MVRPSILLTIFIVCVIGAQARVSRHRNSNSNINTNSFRRNANTNINTNTFSRRSTNSNLNSNTFGRAEGRAEGRAVHPAFSQGGIGNGDPDGDMGLRDHPDHTNEIAKCLSSVYGTSIDDEDMNEINEAIQEILLDLDSRRSTNANLNTNTFRTGMKSRRQKDVDSDDTEYRVLPDVDQMPTLESVDEMSAMDQNLNRNTNQFGGDDTENEIPDRLRSGMDQLGRSRKRVKGSRAGGKTNRKGSTNYNANMNSFRRSNEGDDETEELVENILEPLTRRSKMRSSNSNINTNVFRRNLNRNVNVNSNSNRRLKG